MLYVMPSGVFSVLITLQDSFNFSSVRLSVSGEMSSNSKSIAVPRIKSIAETLAVLIIVYRVTPTGGIKVLCASSLSIIKSPPDMNIKNQCTEHDMHGSYARTSIEARSSISLSPFPFTANSSANASRSCWMLA